MSGTNAWKIFSQPTLPYMKNVCLNSSTPLFAVVCQICSWSSSTSNSPISLSAAMKFDPLSLTIFLGHPSECVHETSCV